MGYMCEICGKNIFEGFASVWRSAVKNNLKCRNCWTVRCKACNLGHFCARCIKEIPDERIQKKMETMGKLIRLSSKFNWVPLVIGGIVAIVIGLNLRGVFFVAAISALILGLPQFGVHILQFVLYNRYKKRLKKSISETPKEYFEALGV